MASTPRRVRFRDWKTFHRDYLLEFASLDRPGRSRLLFRGHAESGWALSPTLDRHRTGGFVDDGDRRAHYEFLLSEFRREAIRFVTPPLELPVGEPFELLARHHGVPSPILDWTTSPYVAAFFAFDHAPAPAADRRVAIWVLDRAAFDEERVPVRLIDDPDLLRANPRALQQQGAFTAIDSIRRPVEQALAPFLTKIELPAAERGLALAHLDTMMINAAHLFPDLDGAARTAAYRGAN